MEGLWVFQSQNNSYPTSNEKTYKYIIVNETRNEAVLSLEDFRLTTIKLGKEFKTLSYEITSDFKCLGLQQFFSNFNPESGLKVGTRYTQLDTKNTKNDLKKQFKSDGIAKTGDLIDDYNAFKNRLETDDEHILINLFCPFYRKNGESTKLEITYSFTNYEISSQEQKTLDDSKALFDSKFGTGSVIETVEQMFADTNSSDSSIKLENMEVGENEVLKVSQ